MLFSTTATATSKLEDDVDVHARGIKYDKVLTAIGPRQQNEAIRLNFPFTCSARPSLRVLVRVST